jgi:lipopolysaccharide/colanic/teichoic acid biosynthesis glycosyltransferase
MLKRALDIVISALLLLAGLPFMAVAALGIKLTSPGPMFYMAQRMGRLERPFAMAKFRTMHVRQEADSQITAPNDARIFRFGGFLRLTKIDELPQLWNVLNGDMSIVGPRPEAVGIVRDHYTDWMKETLRVRPGVTSPGALFGYTHGDAYLDDADPEGSYLANLLGPKLAIERAYIERANVLADIGVMFRTALAVVLIAAGKREFALPAEAEAAKPWFDFGADEKRALP